MQPRTEAQRVAMFGHSKGSIADRMTPAERKEWKAWLKAKGSDSAAFEAQLADRRHRSYNPYAEV